MTLVSYVASGSPGKSVASAAASAAVPAGIANNDILILTISGDESASVVTPSGWNILGDGTPANTGASTTGNKLYLFWKRTTGTESAVSVDAGDHTVIRMHAFRGCPTSADPTDFVEYQNVTVSTTTPCPDYTVLSPETLILYIAGHGVDQTTANFISGSSTFDAAFASTPSKIADDSTNDGVGGGCAVWWGTVAVPGLVTGASLALTTGSSRTAYTVALRPITTSTAAADTGSAVENATVLVVATGDTGTGVDNATLANPIGFDTGTGVDTATVKVFSAETGTGADVATIGQYGTDTGTGADLAGPPLVWGTDTGSGLDTATVRAYATDTGSGLDTAFASNTAVVNDTGSAVDTATVTVYAADTGSATEQAAGFGQDTATAVDTATVRVLAADTGSAVDTAFATNTAVVGDTGAFVDTATVRQYVADTGASVDNAVVTALVPTNDTGTSLENAGQRQVSGDTGAFVDTATIRQTVADTGTGVDNAAPPIVSTFGTDTATAVDNATILVADGDSGAFTDRAIQGIVGAVSSGRVYTVDADPRLKSITADDDDSRTFTCDHDPETIL